MSVIVGLKQRQIRVNIATNLGIYIGRSKRGIRIEFLRQESTFLKSLLINLESSGHYKENSGIKWMRYNVIPNMSCFSKEYDSFYLIASNSSSINQLGLSLVTHSHSLNRSREENNQTWKRKPLATQMALQLRAIQRDSHTFKQPSFGRKRS